jgi:hypothetical protein
MTFSAPLPNVLCVIEEFSNPILSTNPLETGFSSGILKNWYFMELLPEFMIKMFMCDR